MNLTQKRLYKESEWLKRRGARSKKGSEKQVSKKRGKVQTQRGRTKELREIY